MNTEQRELSITLGELRAATATIADLLRGNAHLLSVGSERLPIVHAYLLGAVMRAAGITPASHGTVLQFVQVGYEDCVLPPDKATPAQP